MRASSSRITGGAKSEPPEKGVHLQPTLRPGRGLFCMHDPSLPTIAPSYPTAGRPQY